MYSWGVRLTWFDCKKDFESITEWMAHVLIKSKLPRDASSEVFRRRQDIHLMKLAERTDDPKRGVGAVIVNKDKDIVGLGWNGFPKKSLYGEFPRAAYNENTSRGDNDAHYQDQKYPYIIHAVQNALLMRAPKASRMQLWL